MRLSDLQNKSIVNLIDGKDIGNIIDLEINENGTALGLIVEKHRFLLSNLSSKKEFLIKWEHIEKIGEDVILVSYNVK